MKSLFAVEEKMQSLNKLKIDLISRYYPFSKEELGKFKSILNLDKDHLMNNYSIVWDFELLDILDDKLDWTEIWKIKKITLDYVFFQKYESKIDFSSIQLSKSIHWSNDILNQYGDKFDWSSWLITKEPLSTIENIRKFQDKLNWKYVSQRINLNFDDEIIEEFSDKWEWKELSTNRNLPISIEFIKKYVENLDFDELSKNPAALPMIYKYPKSNRWNWENVILNPAIVYSKETFEFIFSYYKRAYEAKTYTNPSMQEKMALPSFLYRLFFRQSNNISYFFDEQFIKYLPWNNLCKFCHFKLDPSFIERYKDKLNFRESEFIRYNRDVISTEFISQNLYLFNSEHYSFYYLPLSIEILFENFEKINWNYLSSCEKLDWNWKFIEEQFDKFNLYRLSQNNGIYDRLIKEKMTKQEVISFLESMN